MKILSLQAENVKRILCVRIEPGPDGHMVVIGGDNAQGKTSVLDSIAMALGGGTLIPAQPVRQGASKGEIVLQTEEFTVTRTFSTKGGTTLTVTDNDGAKLKSPQAILDGLTSRVSFDPLAFTRMDAKGQAAELRRLVGIDFEALDQERASKYAERTGVNKRVAAQQAKVDTLNRYPDAPKEVPATAALAAKLQAAIDANAENARKREAVVDAADVIEQARTDLNEQEGEVARLRSALEQAEGTARATAARIGELEKALEANRAGIAQLQDVDLAPINAELAQIDEVRAKVEANATWKRENEALVTVSREAAALTQRIEAIDSEKGAALQGAKYPVDGLAFDDSGVTFNGVPFSQASAAEQLRVSVAMGFAMQPKLRIALIRDGSLLDDKSLKLVAETAAHYDGQVWIERVGKGAECSVILEDGEVLEDRTAKA